MCTAGGIRLTQGETSTAGILSESKKSNASTFRTGPEHARMGSQLQERATMSKVLNNPDAESERQMNGPNDLMSIRYTAEALQVSRQRISKLIASGRLETVAVALVNYVPRHVVEREVAARKSGKATAGSTLPAMPGFLTTAQVAARLNRSQSGVLHWIHKGYLNAVRDTVDPRRYVVSEAALSAFDPDRDVLSVGRPPDTPEQTAAKALARAKKEVS